MNTRFANDIIDRFWSLHAMLLSAAKSPLSRPDDHTLTLSTNNLGSLESDQGKLVEAEEMYLRALAGCEKMLGPDHT